VAATTNGDIAGTTLTVASGTGIAAGQVVVGTGVAAGTFVVSGAGTSWVVSISQTVATTSLSFYLATAAIQDEAGSTGNVLQGGRQTFQNIAGAVNIRRRGTEPALAPYGAQAASVADPAGGATVDTEARAQLAAVIDALQAAKLMAT
jgi:hypothetical protein